MKRFFRFTLIVFFFSLEASAQVLFSDDFENGLGKWTVVGAESIKIIDSKDPAHKNILRLMPNGPAVYALVSGSENWTNVRIEGQVMFPEYSDSYLGVIYNFQKSQDRHDFGEIYIKGDGSYVQVNPWRDGNASRLLYDEFTTFLTGQDSVYAGKWIEFKAEIMGPVCHFYVGDMARPKIIFPHFEKTSGMVGVKPRVAGFSVTVDNIKVSRISRFSYAEVVKANQYQPDSLVTKWEVLGPLTRPYVQVEKETAIKNVHSLGGNKVKWLPFETDARGAVITGRITQYYGDRSVAYFRTLVDASADKKAILHFSTVDELAVYVNGQFYSYVYRQGYVQGPGRPWNAWFDFWKNPKHAGRQVEVDLKKGMNQIMVRSRNGDFASGGFFLYMNKP